MNRLLEIKDFIALQGRNGVTSSILKEKFQMRFVLSDVTLKFLRSASFEIFVETNSSEFTIKAPLKDIYKSYGINSMEDVPTEPSFTLLELIAISGTRGILVPEAIKIMKTKSIGAEKLIVLGLVVKRAIQPSIPNERVKSRTTIYHLKRFAGLYVPEIDGSVFEKGDMDLKYVLKYMGKILKSLQKPYISMVDMSRHIGICTRQLRYLKDRLVATGGTSSGKPNEISFFILDNSHPSTLGVSVEASSSTDRSLWFVGYRPSEDIVSLDTQDKFSIHRRQFRLLQYGPDADNSPPNSRNNVSSCVNSVLSREGDNNNNINNNNNNNDDDDDIEEEDDAEEEEEGHNNIKFGSGCIRNLSLYEQTQLHIDLSHSQGMTSAALRDLMGLSVKRTARLVLDMVNIYHVKTVKCQEGKQAMYRLYSADGYEAMMRGVEQKNDGLASTASVMTGNSASSSVTPSSAVLNSLPPTGTTSQHMSLTAGVFDGSNSISNNNGNRNSISNGSNQDIVFVGSNNDHCNGNNNSIVANETYVDSTEVEVAATTGLDMEGGCDGDYKPTKEEILEFVRRMNDTLKQLDEITGNVNDASLFVLSSREVEPRTGIAYVVHRQNTSAEIDNNPPLEPPGDSSSTASSTNHTTTKRVKSMHESVLSAAKVTSASPSSMNITDDGTEIKLTDDIFSGIVHEYDNNMTMVHIQRVNFLLSLFKKVGNVITISDFCQQLRNKERQDGNAFLSDRKGIERLADKLVEKGMIIKMRIALPVDVRIDKSNCFLLLVKNEVVTNQDKNVLVLGLNNDKEPGFYSPEQIGCMYAYHCIEKYLSKVLGAKKKKELREVLLDNGKEKSSVRGRRRGRGSSKTYAMELDDEDDEEEFVPSDGASNRRSYGFGFGEKQHPSTSDEDSDTNSKRPDKRRKKQSNDLSDEQVIRSRHRSGRRSSGRLRMFGAAALSPVSNKPYLCFYPTNSIDYQIDLYGGAVLNILSLCASERKQQNVLSQIIHSKEIKQFVDLLVGITPPNIVYASRELYKFINSMLDFLEGTHLSMEEVRNHKMLVGRNEDVQNQSMNRKSYKDINVDLILKSPSSFRFLMKNCGLPEKYAGLLGVKVAAARNVDREKYDIQDEDLHIISCLVDDGSLNSFDDVIVELVKRDQYDLKQQLLTHVVQQLFLQLSFLKSGGLCNVITTSDNVHTTDIEDVISTINKLSSFLLHEDETRKANSKVLQSVCTTKDRLSACYDDIKICERKMLDAFSTFVGGDKCTTDRVISDKCIRMTMFRNEQRDETMVSDVSVQQGEGESVNVDLWNQHKQRKNESIDRFWDTVLVPSCVNSISSRNISISNEWKYMNQLPFDKETCTYCWARCKYTIITEGGFGLESWRKYFGDVLSQTSDNSTAGLTDEEIVGSREAASRNESVMLAHFSGDLKRNRVHVYRKFIDWAYRYQTGRGIKSGGGITRSQMTVDATAGGGNLDWSSGSECSDCDSFEQDSMEVSDDEDENIIDIGPNIVACASNIDKWWTVKQDCALLKEALRALLIKRHCHLPRRLIPIKSSENVSESDANMYNLLYQYGATTPTNSVFYADADVMSGIPSENFTFSSSFLSDFSLSVSKKALKRVLSTVNVRHKGNYNINNSNRSKGKRRISSNIALTSSMVRTLKQRMSILLGEYSTISQVFFAILTMQRQFQRVHSDNSIPVTVWSEFSDQPDRSKLTQVLKRLFPHEQVPSKKTVTKGISNGDVIVVNGTKITKQMVMTKLLQLYFSVFELLFMLQYTSASANEKEKEKKASNSDNGCDCGSNNYYLSSNKEFLESQVLKRVHILNNIGKHITESVQSNVDDDDDDVGEYSGIIQQLARSVQTELYNRKYICTDLSFYGRFSHYYTLNPSIWQLFHTQLSVEIGKTLLCKGSIHNNSTHSSISCYNKFRNIMLNLGECDVEEKKESPQLSLFGLLSSSEAHISPCSVACLEMESNESESNNDDNSDYSDEENNWSKIPIISSICLSKLFEDQEVTSVNKGQNNTFMFSSMTHIHSGLFENCLNKFKSSMSIQVQNMGVTTEQKDGKVGLEEQNCPWYDCISNQRVLSLYMALVSFVLAILMNKPGCTLEKISTDLPLILTVEQLGVLLNCMVRDGLINKCKHENLREASFGLNCSSRNHSDKITSLFEQKDIFADILQQRAQALQRRQSSLLTGDNDEKSPRYAYYINELL